METPKHMAGRQACFSFLIHRSLVHFSILNSSVNLSLLWRLFLDLRSDVLGPGRLPSFISQSLLSSLLFDSFHTLDI